jgi:putative transposase
LADTRKVKPTQRCHCCGELVKKALSERRHVCACGADCGRDENAARTLLRWLLEGEFWLGTSQKAGASLPSETMTTAALAV